MKYTLPFIACLLPGWALAQPTVPALEQQAAAAGSTTAKAAASAEITGTPTIAGGTQTMQVKAPEGWPPMSATVQAPAVALDGKEKAALDKATAWRNKSDRAVMDPDGVLRWTFGNSQTRVICAPLNICDIELKPGETINNIRLGDTGFWNVTLAVSGSTDGRITHIALTPKEAGREASMIVYTDQRTYVIKLTSVAKNYTARTGFTYPSDNTNSLQETLAAYHDAVGSSGNNENSTGNIAHIQQLRIAGDTRVSWCPINAYTDGRKTYIVFPHEMQFGESPTVLGLNNDAGWFSGPSERRVIYRWMGDRVVVDGTMWKLELILGVGSSQRKITLEKAH